MSAPPIGHNSRIVELEMELDAARRDLSHYKEKVERITALMDLEDASAVDKCMGTRIVLAANTEGYARVAHKQLARAATVKDWRTVAGSVTSLSKAGLIAETVKARGKANEYRLLPLDQLTKRINGAIGVLVQPAQVPASNVGTLAAKPPAPNAPAFNAPSASNAGTHHLHPVQVAKEKVPPKPPLKENIYNPIQAESSSVPPASSLNGALELMMQDLARWINPFMPDHLTAKRTLETQVALHGGVIVKAAYGELKAQIDSGDIVTRPIVVLNKICERLKAKRAAQAAPEPNARVKSGLAALERLKARKAEEQREREREAAKNG